MITSCLLMLLGVPGPGSLFEAALVARTRLSSYTARIDIDSSVPGKHDVRTYDLIVNGTKAIIRLRLPGTATVQRSDRYYELLSDRLVGYDAITNERLQRVDSVRGSIASRLVAAMGPIDDALTMILEPQSMKLFFDGFRGAKDWRQVRNGGIVSIVSHANKKETTFRFDAKTHFLSEVMVKLSNSKLHWTYKIQPGGIVALKIPNDARNVTSFAEQSTPPVYASKETETVVKQMLKAYDKLHTGKIQVTENQVPRTTFWVNGLKLREDRVGFSWAYDGSKLTVFNKSTNQFYRGRAIRVVLSEYIVPLGGEVDPYLRQLLAHKTPFGQMFPSIAHVKLAGSAAVAGVPVDILKVTGSGAALSIFVRKDNHLIGSVEAETIDKTSHLQTMNVRQYVYSDIGTAPNASLFQLSPGDAKVLALPKPKVLEDSPKNDPQS